MGDVHRLEIQVHDDTYVLPRILIACLRHTCRISACTYDRATCLVVLTMEGDARSVRGAARRIANFVAVADVDIQQALKF